MSAPIALTSPHNELVRLWRSLGRDRAARLENGAFMAEGEHMAQEALRTGYARALIVAEGKLERYDGLISDAAGQGLPVYLISPRALDAIADTRTPQGVFCQCAAPRSDRPVEAPLCAVLQDVQDPGNVGTVLRTLDAIGNGCCVLTRGCADPLSPKALRATMGAVFRVPFYLTDDLPSALADLRARGCRLMAGALDGTPFYDRPEDPDRVCLLIGNEGRGLSGDVRAMADISVRLPMQGGAESLNAAVAFAVMAYDVLRRRQSK